MSDESSVVLLYKCMSKAMIAEGDQLHYGPNWALARRAALKVFDDHFECGDWTIPYPSITKATLYSIRSTLGIPGYILKMETAEKTYHFGLNWGKFWKGELPFEVSREKGKLGYSTFSIILRVVLIGYIAWWLWGRYG